MARIPTVVVERNGGPVTINACDYNAGRDRLWQTVAVGAAIPTKETPREKEQVAQAVEESAAEAPVKPIGTAKTGAVRTEPIGTAKPWDAGGKKTLPASRRKSAK